MSGLVTGVVNGRVTKVDPAANPGWIEVEFVVEEGNTRTLARLATAMAGDKRGTWLMPEVQDEVLIAFQNGHPAEPYVIGYLWNGGVTVPETTQQKRVMKSRRGHTITFDDSDSNKVEIRTNEGHTITLDDTTNANKIEIKTSGATPHSVTLDNKAKKIQVQSAGPPPQTITLDDATKKLELMSNAHTITMDASGIRLRAGGRQVVVTPQSVAFS